MIKEAKKSKRSHFISPQITCYLVDMWRNVSNLCAMAVSTSCGHNYTMYNVGVKLAQKKAHLIFSRGYPVLQRKQNTYNTKKFYVKKS